jgi:hypothetical protein
MPAVDLTERARSFITPNGIEIKDAKVPPGTHTIRISVSDTEGRSGSADLTFSVTK